MSHIANFINGGFIRLNVGIWSENFLILLTFDENTICITMR